MNAVPVMLKNFKSINLTLVLSLIILSPFFLVIEKADAQSVPSAGVVEPERPEPILPEIVEEPLFEVPPAAQRSLDSALSFSIPVAEFVVTYDHPQYIPEEIQQQVLVLISNYIVEKPSTLNFSQLEEAADTITNGLRQRGFLLAKAILPPQEVEKGIVHLRVLVGMLGDAETQNNQLYSSRLLQKTFEKQIGVVVKTNRVESSLLRINDMPGINAVAVFRPGGRVGETNIRINVVDENPVSAYTRIDNYGVESIGDIRLLAGIAVNNITGHADRLTVDAIKTFHPGDLRNARVGYEITEPNLIHTLGLMYSETRYEVKDTVSKTEGETEIGELYLRSGWIRQQNYNLYSRLGLSTKRAEQSIVGNVQGVDRLTVLTASIIADSVDTRFLGLQRATLTWHQGFDDFVGSMDKQGNHNSLTFSNDNGQLSGKFEKVSASYTRLQTISTNHSLLLRLSGQYTDDSISSLEKMSLGGPYAVRAYSVGELSSDTAGFASLAWQINGGFFSSENAYGENSWSDILTVSFFFDWAEGKDLNGGGGSSRDHIQGAGAEVRLSFPEHNAYVQLAVAEPISNYNNNLNQANTQYWVALGIEF